MRGKITVIAFHRAKPGKEQALREALLAVRAPTLKEKGCINYDLHESPSLPGVSVFLENWESKADFVVILHAVERHHDRILPTGAGSGYCD